MYEGGWVRGARDGRGEETGLASGESYRGQFRYPCPCSDTITGVSRKKDTHNRRVLQSFLGAEGIRRDVRRGLGARLAGGALGG